MKRIMDTAEQVIRKLEAAEQLIAHGPRLRRLLRDRGNTDFFLCWLQKCGGMKGDDARCLD